MTKCQRSLTGWFVVGLLLLSSTSTIFQLGIISQSYGQLGSQITQPPGPPGTQTVQPPGPPTTGNVHSGNLSWTQTGPRSPGPPGNQTTRTQTGPPGPPGNQTTLTQIGPPGNQTTRVQTGFSGPPRNQTTRTQIGPPGPPENQTKRERGGVPPGLVNGWAHSNMSIVAKNLTQPVVMNGTHRVRLGFIAVNLSSSNQVIHNVAFNQSIAQVKFDRDGSIGLIVNSSAKPARVFADNMELSEAQSLNGLTPESEAWVYDQNSHTLFILADPLSITLFYGSTTTPIPEFPAALALVLVGCLASTLIITKTVASARRSRRLHHI